MDYRRFTCSGSTCKENVLAHQDASQRLKLACPFSATSRFLRIRVTEVLIVHDAVNSLNKIHLLCISKDRANLSGRICGSSTFHKLSSIVVGFEKNIACLLHGAELQAKAQ